ncbi:MAG: GGDEF domain-containing protein [Lachnospiraceae bacterium]|nr:GGDEF domain-containing protein [Lachnospiraceae bacterium]
MDFSGYSESITEYINTLKNYRNIDANELKWAAEKLQEEGKHLNDPLLICYSGYHLASSYYLLAKADKAVETFNKYIPIMEDNGFNDLLIRTYNMLGIIYFSKFNIPSSVQCYFGGLSLAKEHGNVYYEGVISYNIGNLYYEFEDYEGASYYFKDALKSFNINNSDLDNLVYYLVGCSVLGICYNIMDNVEEATKIYNIISEKLPADFYEKNLCSIYLFYASYFHLIKDMKKCDDAVKKMIMLARDQEEFISYYDDYIRLADLLIDIEKYEDLKDLLFIIEDKVSSFNNHFIDAKIADLKIKYYEAMGIDNDAYRKALETYYEKYVDISSDEKQTINDVLSIRIKYDKQVKSQKRLEDKREKLRVKSETDALTGIPNRYRLTDYSNIVYEQAYHMNKRFAFEIFDIDYFKNYNDTYGHQKGDEILKNIGNILKKMSNDKIFVSRYGGDEFVIVYYDMKKEEVLSAASKLRDTILAANMPHCDSFAADRITISQGIFVGKPTKKLKLWDFMYYADLCLYQLKKSCRNSIHISDNPIVNRTNKA